MSALFVTFAIFVAGLLGVLLWSTGRKRSNSPGAAGSAAGLTIACRHVANFPQIRQALDSADLRFIKQRSGSKASQQLQAERRRVALRYLEGLREDFDQLMSSATVIAALSPEVDAREESRRFRLNVAFQFRYTIARLKFAVHSPASSAIGDLAAIVSSLAVDLDRTVSEIAANAALAQSQRAST